MSGKYICLWTVYKIVPYIKKQLSLWTFIHLYNLIQNYLLMIIQAFLKYFAKNSIWINKWSFICQWIVHRLMLPYVVCCVNTVFVCWFRKEQIYGSVTPPLDPPSYTPQRRWGGERWWTTCWGCVDPWRRARRSTS